MKRLFRVYLVMIASVLLSVVLAATSAGERARPPGSALIGAGSPPKKFDDRVAAFKALERLGSEALPALRAARGLT